MTSGRRKSYDKLTQDLKDRLEYLGERLREARMRRGWTQKHLAESVGISVSTVKAIESGSFSTPIGMYGQVLEIYRMQQDLDGVARAENDHTGASLAATGIRKRARRKPSRFHLELDI